MPEVIPSARLAALHVVLPDTPAPVGAYVPARIHGGLVFVTGQLAFRDGAILHPGVLGAEVSVEQGRDAARTCALNAIAAAAQAAGGVDHLGSVLQITGFLATTSTFTGHSEVLNGASEVLVDVFGAEGKHTRSNVGAVSLPLRSPVELQVTFALLEQ